MDLRPVPRDVSPLSPEGFAVLLAVLLAASHLDGRALAEAVDDVDVKTKVRCCARRALQLHCAVLCNLVCFVTSCSISASLLSDCVVNSQTMR